MVWIAFRPERKLWPSLARSNYAVEAEQHRHHRKEIFERFSFLFLFHPIIPVIMNLQFCLLHVTVKKSTYEAITIPSKKKKNQVKNSFANSYFGEVCFYFKSDWNGGFLARDSAYPMGF